MDELNESLYELGELMADNLNSMGVDDAEADDGLITLVDKILDIAPSVGGINVLTNITCNVNHTEISVNNPVTVSGVLSAEYDDESQVNTDFKGFLTGATVKIYNGETLLGTTITDNEGAYSFSYTPMLGNSLSLKAVFEGTTFFEECESNVVNVTVYLYYNATEKTYGGTTNTHQLYDSDMSVNLPTNAEISFDVKTGTTSTSKDYRYWFLPKSQFNGMNYPSCGIYFDKKPSYIYLGKMVDGTNSGLGSFNCASNQYITIKYVKEGTNVKVYTDDTLQTTISLSCIDNFSDWTISLMTWSGTETRYIKNVKVKSLIDKA